MAEWSKVPDSILQLELWLKSHFCFRYHRIHILQDLSWTQHVDIVASIPSLTCEGIQTALRSAQEVPLHLHHRSSWQEASQPGMGCAPNRTDGLYREWCYQMRTSSALPDYHFYSLFYLISEFIYFLLYPYLHLYLRTLV